MVAKNVRRLGVGAAPTTAQQDAAAADWTKSGKMKILSIGKRRQDEQDEGAIDGQNQEDSSSDEEEGRTSAVKERKRKVPKTFHDATEDEGVGEAPKGKKKKIGKKERAQDNNAAALNKSDDKDKPPVNDDQTDEDGKLAGSNIDATEAVTKKHKRKKSRSRQKNIRKDNRTLGDKPSHLVLGTSEYAGRPLTKATKEKLGLSTQRADDGAAATKSKRYDSAPGNANEIDVGGKDDANAANQLTAIGDCIVGKVVEIPKEGTTACKTQKKPKRKFKNC
jgi:hypothetical protein